MIELTTVATVLAALIGAGVIAMSLNAFRAPQSAAGFGIPDTPTDTPSFRSWLAVKAVRDLACGLLILVMLAAATPDLVGWFLLIATGIPIGDAVIVLRSKGPKAVAYGVHGATAAVMLTASILFLAA